MLGFLEGGSHIPAARPWSRKMPGWTGDLVFIPNTEDRITQKAGVVAPALCLESASPAQSTEKGNGVCKAHSPEV